MGVPMPMTLLLYSNPAVTFCEAIGAGALRFCKPLALEPARASNRAYIMVGAGSVDLHTGGACIVERDAGRGRKDIVDRALLDAGELVNFQDRCPTLFGVADKLEVQHGHRRRMLGKGRRV